MMLFTTFCLYGLVQPPALFPSGCSQQTVDRRTDIVRLLFMFGLFDHQVSCEFFVCLFVFVIFKVGAFYWCYTCLSLSFLRRGTWRGPRSLEVGGRVLGVAGVGGRGVAGKTVPNTTVSPPVMILHGNGQRFELF